VAGVNSDIHTWVPLLQKRTVTRAGINYVTQNTYHSSTGTNPNSSRLNDYGRPYQIAENPSPSPGQLSRTTTRAFQYGFAPYIVDRLQSETVVSAGDTFIRTSTYDLSNGFKTQNTSWARPGFTGITTTYTRDTNSKGDVASIKDAGNNTTSFTHDWGTLKDTVTPATAPNATISRVINMDGTIQSETHLAWGGGASDQPVTTTFEYDALGRLTAKTPPASSPTVFPTTTSYDIVGGVATSVTVTQGPSSTRTNLDGFGRPTATSNNVGVKTATSHDALGRKTFESYPYDTTANTSGSDGNSYQYDGLDRLIRKTNTADGTFVKDTYTGMTVSIQDENAHTTQQTWSAYGHPASALLTTVVDGDAKTTTYTYEGLGRLKSVTHNDVGNLQRTWIYDNRALLQTETYPESGATTYTYDAQGNVKTRRDANGEILTYCYTAAIDSRIRIRLTAPAHSPRTRRRTTPSFSTTGAVIARF
jgi:YD repeat-containing protein